MDETPTKIFGEPSKLGTEVTDFASLHDKLEFVSKVVLEHGEKIAAIESCVSDLCRDKEIIDACPDGINMRMSQVQGEAPPARSANEGGRTNEVFEESDCENGKKQIH